MAIELHLQFSAARVAHVRAQFSEDGFDVAKVQVGVDRVGENLVQDLAVAMVHWALFPDRCFVKRLACVATGGFDASQWQHVELAIAANLMGREQRPARHDRAAAPDRKNDR